ncbi:MAG TPA: hypothetical protein VG205_11660, partial [Acidimicrobiales bacterium]|nr:hypothetical protein [Acidimicrobiales bacterium]
GDLSDGDAAPSWSSSSGEADHGDSVASLTTLTEAPPETVVAERVLVVPKLTTAAIGLCVAFTVVLGIIPGPIVDFAHQATLLFP